MSQKEIIYNQLYLCGLLLMSFWENTKSFLMQENKLFWENKCFKSKIEANLKYALVMKNFPNEYIISNSKAWMTLSLVSSTEFDFIWQVVCYFNI